MSNNRTLLLLARTINGIATGGQVSATIAAGYENSIRSAPDGLQVPVIDRDTQFVRGSMVTEDWVHVIDLLTGTVGTDVFYERKSGAAAATGYIKHTLNNPVVYRASLSQSQGQYLRAGCSYECRFDSANTTWTDVWTITDAQAAPTYVAAARGGWRVTEAVFDPAGTPITIGHILSFNLDIAMQLVKACNDADLGYTAVDALPEAGMIINGTLVTQDHSINASAMLASRLIAAGRKSLRLTVKSSEGATNKVITVAGVIFGALTQNPTGDGRYNADTLNFIIGNSTTTPLTLNGDNKLITITNE
jgi:hypothetical protein